MLTPKQKDHFDVFGFLCLRQAFPQTRWPRLPKPPTKCGARIEAANPTTASTRALRLLPSASPAFGFSRGRPHFSRWLPTS